MSLHHHKIFHASPANRAQDGESVWRALYSTHVRPVAITRRQAALVRASGRLHHFRHEPHRTRDMDPDFYHLREHAAEAKRIFSITAPAARNLAPIL